jgi:hypothetical protein
MPGLMYRLPQRPVTACRLLSPRRLAYADQAGRAGLPAGFGIGWLAGKAAPRCGWRAGFGRAGGGPGSAG